MRDVKTQETQQVSSDLLSAQQGGASKKLAMKLMLLVMTVCGRDGARRVQLVLFGGRGA